MIAMATWKDYKKHVYEVDSQRSADLAEISERAKIIQAMIDQRHHLNLSQRELAEMCGLPHSSVARIESGKTTPNLGTLLKIFDQLGLALTVKPVSTVRSTR